MNIDSENAYKEAQWITDDAYDLMERVKKLVANGDLPIEAYRNACASVVAAREVKKSIDKRRNLGERGRVNVMYGEDNQKCLLSD